MRLARLRHNKMAFAIAVFGTVSAAKAGDINPPAGPVGPTMLTLEQLNSTATAAQDPRTPVNAANTPGDADSLFKITAPGSYYLTANITGESGKSGIKIATNQVTLDLNGFRLQGAAGSLHGIDAAGQRYVSILNGTILNWSGWGINGAANYARLQDVRVRRNEQGGLSVGPESLVVRCIAIENDNIGGSGNGITTGNSSVVSHCVSTSNAGVGVVTGSDSVIAWVVSRGNQSFGIDCGQGSVVVDSLASENGNTGIDTGGESTVRGCTSTDNLGGDGDGIDGGAKSTIESCTVQGNSGRGIHADNSLIVHNTAVNNSPNIEQSGSTLIENHAP